MGARFTEARAATARFARGLLGCDVDLFAAPPNAERPFAIDRDFYLPEAWPEPDAAFGRSLYFAAAAHLAAHTRFGGPRFARKGLKPIQIVLVSLLEDARVEARALRELPGLARLWRRFHRAHPSDHPTFPALCARISRGLFDAAYADPHPLVAKARSLFFAGAELPTSDACRGIGSLLGNDIGQSRLSFNAREYVAQPAYRDDHRCLWEEAVAPPSQPAPAELLERYAKVQRPTDAIEGHALEGAQAARPSQPSAGAELSAPAGAHAARYPEWDYYIGRTRPGFATVREQRPATGDATAPLELAADRRNPNRRVRTLRFEALARLRRQADGETLDLDRAIEASVDRRARRTPDQRVYARTGRRRDDLCVLLLLDLSRSTGDAVRGSGQSRLELARDACLLLADSLAEQGTRFAIHGFSSNGRHDVEYHLLKEIEGAWNAAARSAVTRVEPRLSTRMGAAVRHAGRCLDRARERRRLLLLVTDGEPSDIDAHDPLYLLHDARHAVDTLRHRGHAVFAVSLDADADRYVKQIFGRGRYAVVSRCEQLPAALPRLYATIAR